MHIIFPALLIHLFYRCLGYYKARIKSRRSPGKNVGNIMLRMAATNFYNRNYALEKEKKKENNCYISELTDGYELWSPHLNRSANVHMFQDVNLDYYLSKYWNRVKAGKINKINPEIIVGGRLYSQGNVYESSYYSRQDSRLASFVKLSLPEDRYSRCKSKTENKWKIFFGEVVLYFANKYEGK